MKFAAFDIEIAKELPDDFGSWERFSPLGISCAAVSLSDADEVKFWKGVPKLNNDECVDMVLELINFAFRYHDEPPMIVFKCSGAQVFKYILGHLHT